MVRLGGLMMLMLFVAQGRPAPGKVNSTYDESANFQTLKTYSWVQGSPAFDPSVDKTIVAAVDSEMSALGFTKAAGTARRRCDPLPRGPQHQHRSQEARGDRKSRGRQSRRGLHRGTARDCHAGHKVWQTGVGGGLRRAAESCRGRAGRDDQAGRDAHVRDLPDKDEEVGWPTSGAAGRDPASAAP